MRPDAAPRIRLPIRQRVHYSRVMADRISIPDLIAKAGGPAKIARASRRTSAVVSVGAVQKWRIRGIPDEHWGLLVALAGVSLETIYRADREFRARKKNRSSRTLEAA